ncbi:MAG: hypothetical protein L6R41_007495 [Letrouitia leprolyta]|nr:MAG: hypothetical protein L6R41_007495 [Letrouitia leprolyta]
MLLPVLRSSFWEYFLRSAGLAIINEFLWIGRRKRSQEEAKVVVEKSLKVALGRCSIHILPIIVSTIILWINFKQTFIGIDFRSLIRSETINIALLQTAAKVQELLIVASLTAVAFQLIRYELLFGDGLSLGTVAAGFDFVKLSYFWSPEFLGSLKGLDTHRAGVRRATILLFFIVIGGIAAFVGPSCAVLLIPQAQDWPAGSKTFYLHNATNLLWPISLSASSVKSRLLCSSIGAADYGICPSGGYYSIWSHYSQIDRHSLSKFVPIYARQLSGNEFYWSSGSPSPIQVRTMSLGILNESSTQSTSFIQPRLDVSVVLEDMMQDWWVDLQSKRAYAGNNVEDRAAVTHSLNPITSVRCGGIKNLVASDRVVLFPALDPANSDDAKNLSSRWLNTEPSRHLQFNWVPLSEQGQSITTGALLQSPWSLDNQSRIVIGCTVQARWIPAQIRTDGYSFWQGWYPKNITWEGAYPSPGSALLDGSLAPAGMKAIATDQEWLAMLTPKIKPGQPGYRDWQPTTIEGILDGSRLFDGLFDRPQNNPIDIWQDYEYSRSMLFISIIGSVFNDGLARYGIEELFDQEGPPSSWSLRSRNYTIKKGTKFRVDFSIGGLSYRLTVAQKLAASVLLLHILIALMHIAWLVHTRESSGCWDSVLELVVLAQNSRPAASALANTAAGIKHSSTFAKKVCIRPTNLPGQPRLNHLEMIYDEGAKIADSAEMTNLQENNVGDSAIHPEQIAHPSTWPVRRHRVSAASNSTIEQSSYAEIAPNTPLIGCDAEGAQRNAPAARIQVGQAYG